MERIAQRMGPANFTRRQELELRIREERMLRYGQAIIRSPKLPHRIVKTILRYTLLEKRALRNFAQIQLENHELPIDGLPEAMDGFRVLHIADLHLDLAPEHLVPAILPHLEGLEYDLCVFTGDYFNRTFESEKVFRELTKILERIHQPVYGILGNHDALRFVPKLEKLGIRMLINESVALDEHGTIWLAGVDNSHLIGAPDLAFALRNTPQEASVILLAHCPSYAEDAAIDARVKAMLSGHTHGGQLCLPGGFPLIHNCDAPRERNSGEWRLKQMVGYTSRGTGSSGVPARLNCPPEITIHTLRSAE